MDDDTELSSIPSSTLRSEIQCQLGCSDSEFDALVGSARPPTLEHLNKFLQDTPLDAVAARKLLEHSKSRPGRRNLAKLFDQDIVWAVQNQMALSPPSSPTKSEAVVTISPSKVEDSFTTSRNFEHNLVSNFDDSTSETKQGTESSGSPKRKWNNTESPIVFNELSDSVLHPKTKRHRPGTTESAKHKSIIVQQSDHGTEMESTSHKGLPNPPLEPSDSTRIKGRGKFDVPKEFLALLKDDRAQLNDYIVNPSVALVASVATKPFLFIDSMTENFRGKPSLETPAHVFMPLHLVSEKVIGHWVLAIVNETRLSVQVYDSMPSLKSKDQIDHKLRKIYKKHSWPSYEQLIFSSPMKQQNGHDCGIMVFIAALYRAAGFEVPDGAEHAPWRAILFELLRSQRSYSIKIPESYNELVKLLKKLSSSTHSLLTENQEVNRQYEAFRKPDIPALRTLQVLLQAAGAQEPEAVSRISRVIDCLEALESKERRGLKNDIMLTEALMRMLADAREP